MAANDCVYDLDYVELSKKVMFTFVLCIRTFDFRALLRTSILN